MGSLLVSAVSDVAREIRIVQWRQEKQNDHLRRIALAREMQAACEPHMRTGDACARLTAAFLKATAAD